MKKNILILFSAIALAACNNKSAPAADMAKEQQALVNTDKDFSAMVGQQGLAKAMEKFYDNDVVAIGMNQPVAVGKASILKQNADMKMDSLTTLSWASEKAVVSASGDLGYVWGRYQFKMKNKEGVDTTMYGAYCTVYKKEPDGSWKAVVDQNNDTPKP